ncbi:Alpha-latroinsectotoxin [Dactylella cylindrospora]|nr:Alpha-latroinsectotoxin [Dactylella cylindrospora]
MNYCDEEEKGNTPLHMAAEKGLYNIVVFLCAAGHEQDGISRNYAGQTPLITASGSTHPSADDVAFYLASEFPQCVNWRDKAGMTAILLDSDADVNAFDPLGNTALHYASAYGQLKAIRSLVDRGTNFEHRNCEGWKAKDYSFSKSAELYFQQLVETSIVDKSLGGSAMSSIAGVGIGGGIRSTPSSRDGKRPGTAGSFSYGAGQITSTSTITLVPNSSASTSSTLGFGVGMGSSLSIANSSSGLSGDDTTLSRPLKSAASMVEFSHVDRNTVMRTDSSSPAIGASGSSASVSSHASSSAFGSLSSFHGGSGFSGLPTTSSQQQQSSQGFQGQGGTTSQRSLYDPFTPLRPRASSGG